MQIIHQFYLIKIIHTERDFGRKGNIWHRRVIFEPKKKSKFHITYLLNFEHDFHSINLKKIKKIRVF